MKDNYQLLIEKLDAFIRKYYKNQLIRGTIYSFTLSLAFYLLVTSIEYFAHFNTGLRTTLFYAFVFLPLAELFMKPNTENLTGTEEEMAKKDKIYDYMLYFFVFLQFVTLWIFLNSRVSS